MPRVAVVCEIPTPYRHPVFRQIRDRGDPETDFFFLARTQSDRHWDPRTFPDLPAAYLRGTRITFPGYHTIHLNWGVLRTLRNRSYDAFVLGGYAQPALIRLLRHCWRRNIPYVMISESHLGKKRPRLVEVLKDRFVRNVYEHSRANLVMGGASADYVRHYGAPPDAIFPFPNSVDGPAFTGEVDRLRPAVRPGRTLLFVGTLNARKGVDLLFRSFRELAGRFPGWNLRYVGSGALEGRLRAETARSGLSGRVSFDGFVQPADLPRRYAEADLFVLPSREEPFGAVVCEALAASLPVVVSSSVGAAGDFVRDGRNGRIFPAGDERALSAVLGRLLEDDSLRERMGADARRTMAEWTHRRLVESFSAAVRAALR